MNNHNWMFTEDNLLREWLIKKLKRTLERARKVRELSGEISRIESLLRMLEAGKLEDKSTQEIAAIVQVLGKRAEESDFDLRQKELDEEYKKRQDTELELIKELYAELLEHLKEREALADKRLKEMLLEEMLNDYKRKLEEIRNNIQEVKKEIVRLEEEHKEVTERINEDSEQIVRGVKEIYREFELEKHLPKETGEKIKKGLEKVSSKLEEEKDIDEGDYEELEEVVNEMESLVRPKEKAEEKGEKEEEIGEREKAEEENKEGLEAEAKPKEMPEEIRAKLEGELKKLKVQLARVREDLDRKNKLEAEKAELEKKLKELGQDEGDLEVQVNRCRDVCERAEKNAVVGQGRQKVEVQDNIVSDQEDSSFRPH